MAAAVTAAGSSLRLGAVRGRKPAFEEDDVQRIREVLAEVCAELGTPVLPRPQTRICASFRQKPRDGLLTSLWLFCPSLPFE